MHPPPAPSAASLLAALLDHAAWADARAHAAVASLPPDAPERAQAARLLAHLAAAEHVWAARLAGREPAHPVWPELAPDAAAALSARSLAELRAAALADPDALGREVAYRTGAGQAFRNTAADLLAQVLLHGSYHRGQIALLARAGGGAPVATDYIVHLRERPAPAA